jgi:hypothetical protein
MLGYGTMPRTSREWMIAAMILGPLPIAFAGTMLVVSATENYYGCRLGGYGGYSLVGPCNQAYFVQLTPAFLTGSILIIAAVLSISVAWGLGFMLYVRPRAGKRVAGAATLWSGALTAVGFLASGGWLADAASGLSARIAQTCSFATTCQQVQVSGINQMMGLAGQLIFMGAAILAFTVLAATGQLERLSRLRQPASATAR